MDLITIDYETHGIVGNPVVTPPKPVGCAIWVPGSEPKYYSWGHPEFAEGDPRWPKGSKNDTTWDEFHQYLTRIKECGMPVLMHNAAFDVSVQNEYFCNARYSWINEGWSKVHDTLYLVFLADPYAPSFSLKPSADRYLGMAPSEQDDLYKWILAHVPEATPKTCGAFIALAPSELVGRYAIGDVVRTRKLFDLLHARIVEQGMEKAYDRERRLLPTLLAATQRGIRLDRDLLDWHKGVYEECLATTQERLCLRLGAGPEIFDNDEAMANALERSGAVTEWVLTPKSGKRSMSKDNLKIVIPEIKILMDYKSNLETCLQTFMRPWLEYSRNDRRLRPNWNQVRQARNDYSTKGTRTGRLSSDSPNFQNVPTTFEDALGNALPVPDGLHQLPKLRQYCLPEDGHVWVKRDFSSQEIRILAHFEDGSLCAAYHNNPNLDPHQMARELIRGMVGVEYARPTIKITGFSIIYGTGGPGLSGQLGCPVQEAYEIKRAYLDAMPGIRSLMQDVQQRGRNGEAIRTWGGRLYLAEPPKLIDGRYRDFAYKLLNYLIQGSAADQTKESINDWADNHHWEESFVATVHDEINISVPREEAARGMQSLKVAMDADRFDVPMRSEGFVGENWAELKEWDDEQGTYKN